MQSGWGFGPVFSSSSMAERPAVNGVVRGSSPRGRAKKLNAIALPAKMELEKIFRRFLKLFGVPMARGLTDTPEPTPDASSVDLKQVADMLYAIFCAVQEINAKLPAANPEERPLNGL